MTVHHLLAYAQCLEKEARANEERSNKRTCYRKHEYQDLASYKTLTNSGRANFDRFLRSLDLYFDLTGFRLGYMQEKLMHEIIVTFLRVMYGKDLLGSLHDIEKRFAVRELRDATAILYPRRAGKTKTQTIAGGCIVCSQPIGNCSCYNIGGRQARDWLQEAYDVMNVFKNTSEFGWTLDRADAREYVQIKTAFVYSTGSAFFYHRYGREKLQKRLLDFVFGMVPESTRGMETALCLKFDKARDPTLVQYLIGTERARLGESRSRGKNSWAISEQGESGLLLMKRRAVLVAQQ